MSGWWEDYVWRGSEAFLCIRRQSTTTAAQARSIKSVHRHEPSSRAENTSAGRHC
jgi:hypothetical protein